MAGNGRKNGADAIPGRVSSPAALTDQGRRVMPSFRPRVFICSVIDSYAILRDAVAEGIRQAGG